MELMSYLQPLWVNALITLVYCLLGGLIVCGLVALGIKRGFEDREKRRKKGGGSDEL